MSHRRGGGHGADRHGWAHDEEYSLWHTTHHHVLGLDDWRTDDDHSLDSTAPAPSAHSRGVDAASAESQDADDAGIAEQAQQEAWQHAHSAQHSCGSEQILRLRARLLTRSVDMATALEVGHAMHRRLDGQGAVSASAFDQHLQQVIQSIIEEPAKHAHTMTSPTHVRQAIRQCRSSYPGVLSITYHLSPVMYHLACITCHVSRRSSCADRTIWPCI